MGARQHRAFWRRPRQRHDLRPIGRRRQDGMLTGFPAAKGLFHRAIIMSTLAETAITGQGPEHAAEAGELLMRRRASRLRNGAARDTGSPRRASPPSRTTGRRTARTRPSQRSCRCRRQTLPAIRSSPASPLSAAIPILTGSNECEGCLRRPERSVLDERARQRRRAARSRSNYSSRSTMPTPPG